VYSRYGWNHPGPWGLWILAVPYRLLGTDHGLLAAALLVNLVWFAILAWLLLRAMPRASALICLVGMWIVVAAYGPGGLSDPWNPWLALAPSMVGAVAAASLRFDHRLAPLAVVASAVGVQNHAGHALLAATVVILVAVSLVRKPASARLVVLTVGAFVVMWAPLAIDAATNPRGGNVGEIVRDALGRSGTHREIDGTITAGVGPVEGLRLFGRELGLDGTWRTHTPDADEWGAVRTGSWISVGLVMAVGVGLALALARLELTDEKRWWLVATLAIWVASAVSFAIIRGTPYAYVVGFGVVPVLLAWSALWRVVEVHTRAVQAGAAIAVVLLAGYVSWTFRIAQPQEHRISEVGTSLAPAVLEYLQEADADEVWIGPRNSWVVTSLQVGVRREQISLSRNAKHVIKVIPAGGDSPEGAELIAQWRAPENDKPDVDNRVDEFFQYRYGVDVYAQTNG